MYDPTKPYKHELLRLIESTWNTPYVRVERGIYPIFKKKFSFPEVQHTDGIGTKGGFHWIARTFKDAALDALAMNLNDLALVGAVPYALQNHIVLPKDDHPAILAIVSAIASECEKRKIAMTGGETSIHTGSESMDISVTISGLIKKKRENLCRVGDTLIGLPSNGLHANGLTFARHILGSHLRPEYTRSTPVYWDEVMQVLEKHTVHGMMHITGGAFSKLKDILGKADAHIAFPKGFRPRPIFYEIFDRGASSRRLYTTLNCGIGFVLSVPKEDAKRIVRSVKGALVVGEITKGSGKVHIRSVFDDSLVTL